MICLCFRMSGTSAGVAQMSGDDWGHMSGYSVLHTVYAEAGIVEMVPLLTCVVPIVE